MFNSLPMRLPTVDAARGIAVLAMFVAHGYDAWVSPVAKLGLGYRVTREIAAAALPSFLLLAGVSVALQWQRAPLSERASVRRAIALRGVRLIAAGYALALAFAWLDGGLEQPSVWLRADVLHAIGASMLVLAALVLARAGGTAVGRALWVALALVLLCPVLVRVPADRPGVLGYALAPFVPIVGVSRFAAVPLAAFSCVGLAFVLGGGFAWTTRRSAYARLALAGSGLALLAVLATRAAEAWSEQPLSLAHPALPLNGLDGLGRALGVLGLAGLAPAKVSAALAGLGRHSLVLYAVHLPFCYGRFGAALRRQLDLTQASLALAVLVAAALALVAALELSAMRRAPAPARAPSA